MLITEGDTSRQYQHHSYPPSSLKPFQSAPFPRLMNAPSLPYSSMSTLPDPPCSSNLKDESDLPSSSISPTPSFKMVSSPNRAASPMALPFVSRATTSTSKLKRKAEYDWEVDDDNMLDDDESPSPYLSLQRTRSMTIDIKPRLRRPEEPVPILPLPLPSKRFKKKPTSRAVLIPVEQLPVFPLPPLPTINDPELVKQVFTHSSLFERSRGVFEDPEDKPSKHYEKLEHVGDSILGMVVTTWLHETKPRLTCGTATKLKAHLVSNATLSHISGLYNFPQRLNGDPRLLPVLRAQTDVRAALMEAYIAALYFSFPIEIRMTTGLATIDSWLREMYYPLYDFFFHYMRNEHDKHHNAMGAGVDGVVEVAESPELLELVDSQAEGMALLVQMYGNKQEREVSYDTERFETSVGVLWKIRCLVDGVEMGEATRAVKRRARNAAAWEAAKKLGLTEISSSRD